MLQRLFISAFICVAFALPLHAAADRERVQAFLTTTGFDVAVASISQSASHAPAMLGLEAADFGADWSRLADTVFEPKAMTRTAADILAQAMDDEMLAHGAEFTPLTWARDLLWRKMPRIPPMGPSVSRKENPSLQLSKPKIPGVSRCLSG